MTFRLLRATRAVAVTKIGLGVDKIDAEEIPELSDFTMTSVQQQSTVVRIGCQKRKDSSTTLWSNDSIYSKMRSRKHESGRLKKKPSDGSRGVGFPGSDGWEARNRLEIDWKAGTAQG